MKLELEKIINEIGIEKPITNEMMAFAQKLFTQIEIQHQQKTNTAYQTLQSIVTSIGDIVFELDREGKILAAWADDENYFFMPREQFIGKKIKDVFGSTLKEEFQLAIKTVIETRKRYTYDFKSPFDDRYFIIKFFFIKNSLPNTAEIIATIKDFTEEKKIELNYTAAHLRSQQNEDTYRQLIETSSDIFYITDVDGNFTYINTYGCNLIEYTHGEFLTKNYTNIIAPELVNEVKEFYHRQVGIGEPISYHEIQVITKSGKKIWLGQNVQMLFKNGKYVGTQVIARDISKIKNAESSLLQSEERFRNLVEASHDIFYTTDKKGNFTYTNEIAFDKTGFKTEELLGINFTFLIRDDYKKSVQTFYSKQIKNHEAFSYLEFPIIKKDGSQVWVGQNVQLVFKNQEYTGTQAVVRDITNIKNYEHALKQSEERFRKLVQYSSDVTTVLSVDGTIIYESPSFFRLFGYRDSLVGRNVFEYIHPNDVEHAKHEFQLGVEKGGVSEPIEFRFKTLDGNWKYIESIGNNLLDEPSIKGIVVNSREITERKKIETALAETSMRLSAIIESTNNVIFAIDTDYKYIAFNKAHKNVIKYIYGVEIEIGDVALIKDDIGAPDRASMKKLFDRSFAGEQFVHIYETEVNGQKNVFNISVNPIKDAKEKIIGVAIFSQNITAEKNAEEELLRARNEAIAGAQAKSDFLSNMSHEIRTPMNAIIGLSELLLQREMDKDAVEYINSIKYSADNLLVIINDILDFSKIDSGKITFEQIDFNINDLILDLHRTFIHKTQERGIEFITVIDIHVPEVVKGDPYRLNQILMNLVGNSTKFTLKGFIKIYVTLIDETDTQYLIRFDIEDSGVGIPKEKQESIFESFTQAYTDTTRRFGGTGLGLAITKNLTLLQGGKISLQSTLNVGTTFSIEIPFSKATNKFIKSSITQNTQAKNLGGIKILLVEDNLMNQFVAKQIIGKWNATITVANNGSEAIEKLSNELFDLVLMDLQMPEMSGYQATEHIRSKNTTVKNPSIPIIALTADAFAETKRKVFEAGMNDFVTKPFNQEELYLKMIKHAQ